MRREFRPFCRRGVPDFSFDMGALLREAGAIRAAEKNVAETSSNDPSIWRHGPAMPNGIGMFMIAWDAARVRPSPYRDRAVFRDCRAWRESRPRRVFSRLSRAD